MTQFNFCKQWTLKVKSKAIRKTNINYEKVSRMLMCIDRRFIFRVQFLGSWRRYGEQHKLFIEIYNTEIHMIMGLFWRYIFRSNVTQQMNQAIYKFLAVLKIAQNNYWIIFCFPFIPASGHWMFIVFAFLPHISLLMIGW